MAKKRMISVEQIAREVGRDNDEVLMILWEQGYDYIRDVKSVIRKADIDQARSILGIPTKRQFEACSYWMMRMQLSHEGLISKLQEVGIHMSERQRVLPKGAIRALLRICEQGEAIPAPRVPAMAPTIPKKINRPYREVKWSISGHNRSEMHLLSEKEVLRIHESLVQEFASGDDPIEPSGVRNENILSSAISRPETSIGSNMKYPTVEMAAAALLHSMIHDHPFHNGNKRTALVSMVVFLDENGLTMKCSEQELFKFIILVARHGLLEYDCVNCSDHEVMAITRWICENTRLIELGERPLKFYELQRILRDYDCSFEPGSSGSKMNITRAMQSSGTYLKQSKPYCLHTQIFYEGDGRDVAINTIRKLRADLHLDEINGIDSAAFYDRKVSPIGDYINKYRKILHRLSRL